MQQVFHEQGDLGVKVIGWRRGRSRVEVVGSPQGRPTTGQQEVNEIFSGSVYIYVCVSIKGACL